MNKRVQCVNGLIDCHTHSGALDINNYYKKKYPAMQDVNVLVQTMQNNKVDYAITFPMPSTLYYSVNDYWNSGLYNPTGICEFPFAIENEYLLSEISYFEANNILPFLAFSINEKIDEQCRYIRKCYEKHNIYGLKYHSKADQNSLSDLMSHGKAFIELLMELDIPLVFHSETNGISSPLSVFRLIEKYPKLRISLAHYAGMNAEFFREFDRYIKSDSNIFFDTAPSICICGRYAKMKDRIGLLDLDYNDVKSVNSYFIDRYANNILWGTDSPWIFSDNLMDKSEKYIDYSEEIKLKNELETYGFKYKLDTVNKFLFG